ncbi:MAG: hypothetical protein JWP89_1708 [Schlesneria sp.]|nr:hypothetical protein [Schlesneria sp.]
MQFFHGWRRKLGGVTLLIACVFMAIWGRSAFKGDYLRRERGPVSHVFVSANGELKSLSWKSSGRLRGDEISLGLAPGFLSKSYNATTEELGTSKVPFHEFRLQYWSITIPLTLLSAFLILSKPRKWVGISD